MPGCFTTTSNRGLISDLSNPCSSLSSSEIRPRKRFILFKTNMVHDWTRASDLFRVKGCISVFSMTCRNVETSEVFCKSLLKHIAFEECGSDCGLKFSATYYSNSESFRPSSPKNH